MTKGTVQDKGKRLYQVRIENASPLILNGLAILGTESDENEEPKELLGISVPPRRSLTVPADRRRRQIAGAQEGDQVGGTQPERAVTSRHQSNVDLNASCRPG